MNIQSAGTDEGDFVEFVAAGTASKGEFQCAECGYGVTITKTLPTCPMCSGGSWQRSEWAPMHRAAELARQGRPSSEL